MMRFRLGCGDMEVKGSRAAGGCGVFFAGRSFDLKTDY
jgi:hypothetical protein